MQTMKPVILSHGSVSPAGVGTQSLESGFPTMIHPDTEGHPVSLVERSDPALLKWEKSPRLRRASPISYFMVEAVSQALEGAPGIDLSRTAVVGAFFLGCMAYSVRFYREMHAAGRRFASPILFPETVFNTPLSHVVSTLGIGGPVHTQIGDKSCWATALRTAECWLRLGMAEHVVVVGAEEFDPVSFHAFRAAGLLRHGRLIPSEGAGAVLLGNASGGTPLLSRIADGYGFTTRRLAGEAARECLSSIPGNDPVMPTSTSWTAAIESRTAANRLLDPWINRDFEASTASAAWNTIRAAKLIAEGRLPVIVVPSWGLTRQFSMLRLKAKAKASP
jgi:hypothetical protein